MYLFRYFKWKVAINKAYSEILTSLNRMKDWDLETKSRDLGLDTDLAPTRKLGSCILNSGLGSLKTGILNNLG